MNAVLIAGLIMVFVARGYAPPAPTMRPQYASSLWMTPPEFHADVDWPDLSRSLGQWTLLASPGLLLGWLFFPLRPRSRPGRFSLRALNRPPQLSRPENLVTRAEERRDVWALAVALGLAGLGGISQNLTFLLVMSPLVAFRMLSRLWTEVDLGTGQVLYHRTFCGLQITRTGAQLDSAEGIMSGIQLDRPGEDPRFSVCILIQQHPLVPLNTQCLTRQDSHELAQRLALQLNLPYLDHESGGERGPRRRSQWRLLGARNTAPRPPLPPGGEE